MENVSMSRCHREGFENKTVRIKARGAFFVFKGKEKCFRREYSARQNSNKAVKLSSVRARPSKISLLLPPPGPS